RAGVADRGSLREAAGSGTSWCWAPTRISSSFVWGSAGERRGSTAPGAHVFPRVSALGASCGDRARVLPGFPVQEFLCVRWGSSSVFTVHVWCWVLGGAHRACHSECSC